MPVNWFLYGLTSFAMALVVLLRGRTASQLALGQQFYWLGAFGLLTSVYAWGSMFERINPTLFPPGITPAILTAILFASGVVLVRFGIGLIANAGLIPSWLPLLAVVVLVPTVFVIAYAIVTVIGATNQPISAAEWTRYLLLFSGNVFAALGFVRQWRRLRQSQTASNLLVITGGAFLINAFFTGLVSETAALSDTVIETVTHVPVELWRVGSMTLVALLVSGSMNIFENERKQEIIRLHAAREQAQKALIGIRTKSQHDAGVWLDALVKISHRIANMDDADAVLADLVSLARELVQADTATLALYESGERLCLKYQAGADGVQMLDSLAVDNPFICRAAETGRALRYPDDGNGTVFCWHVGEREYHAEVAAVVPLQLNQTPIGALTVARFERQSFSCTDLIGLSHLANQAVIVVEHASMAGRIQSVAVLEERSRIAREMHDSLAQILGYLSLETQTLEALAKQHDEGALLSELGEARATIKSAQADVRENILSLRTTLAGEVGFAAALKQYVEEFGIQTGIQTEMRLDSTQNLTLSPLAETQAVRIVQEALTNVRKHAQATCAQVEIDACDGWLLIRITDNGIGLPENLPIQGHFGLQTMHERAESVGGTLRVGDAPESGTSVWLRLPLV